MSDTIIMGKQEQIDGLKRQLAELGQQLSDQKARTRTAKTLQGHAEQAEAEQKAEAIELEEKLAEREEQREKAAETIRTLLVAAWDEGYGTAEAEFQNMRRSGNPYTNPTPAAEPKES